MIGLGDAALAIVVLALLLDAAIGDPEALWRRLPHPVTLFGRLVATLDRGLNDPQRSEGLRRARGVVAAFVIVVLPAAGGLVVQVLLLALPSPAGAICIALVASVLLAQKSLDQHVAAVAEGLARSLPEGRRAVALVVGRDPERLDAAGVSRAAIETTAESFNDGIVAPAFWLALLGLPGLFAYKAVNTADSMIGHLTPRYAAFGWASARLDDLLNLVPARLAGLLSALAAPAAAGGSTRRALSAMWADAHKHPSPNAGWPEAATAGALGVALCGPTAYDGIVDGKPWLNPAGRRDPGAADIRRGLALYRAACALHVVLYAVLALVVAAA